MELPVRKALKATRERPARLVRQERRVLLVLLELTALREHRELRVLLGARVRLVQKELEGQRARGVLRVVPERQATEAPRAKRVRKDLQVQVA